MSWQSDAEVSQCTLCASTFKWTRRKHHCRLCGRIVCNACSRARRVPLQGSGKAERACDSCAQEGERDADDNESDADEHESEGQS